MSKKTSFASPLVLSTIGFVALSIALTAAATFPEKTIEISEHLFGRIR